MQIYRSWIAVGIYVNHQANTNKQAKQRRTTGREEGQGNTNNRCYRSTHANVNNRLSKKHCKNANCNKLTLLFNRKRRNP